MTLLRQIRPLDWLLVALPAAFALRFVPGWKNETLLFFAAALSIIPLAAWMGRSTEQLGDRVGPGMGALLNATFGNAPELLIGLMALSKGLTEVVKAALTGSIIGNILLVLGTSILVGGIRYPHQRYNQTGTRVAATSLALAVIGMAIPTIFHEAVSRQGAPRDPRLEHNLSLVIATILFATYALWLLFSAFTHRRLFAEETSASVDVDASEAWPLRRSIVVLAVSTLFVAAMSEFLAASVEAACRSLGLTEMFVGVIIVAIVGNAGEHSTAIHVALKNKMDLCLGIAIGSSVQIALLITPVLVFASHLLGHPMTLQFSLPEIAAIALAVGLMVMISGDGECNWVEGAQLLAVYLIMATLFYFLPAAVAPEASPAAPIVAPANR